MMSPRCIRLTAKFGVQSCLLLALAFTARGHSTLTFDLNAPPGYALGGAGNLTGFSTMIAMGTARLRPQNLEIDLTMADGAAYPLLDPGEPPAVASVQSASTEAHFNQAQPRLVQRGATLFTLSQNGATLNPLGVTVELTTAQDIIFHLKYPPVSAGLLRLQINCFDKAQPGQKVILNVLDAAGHSLALASLDANAPAIEVPTAITTTAQATPASHNGIKIAAGLAIGGAVLWLLLKLRPASARN